MCVEMKVVDNSWKKLQVLAFLMERMRLEPIRDKKWI